MDFFTESFLLILLKLPSWDCVWSSPKLYVHDFVYKVLFSSIWYLVLLFCKELCLVLMILLSLFDLFFKIKSFEFVLLSWFDLIIFSILFRELRAEGTLTSEKFFIPD